MLFCNGEISKFAPPLGRSGHTLHGSLGPLEFTPTSGILIGSVIAAGLTAVTSTEIYTQTDHCSPLVAVCCIYAVHVMPPNNNTRFGERGFSYCGPAAWNPFPSDLHDITHTGAFRKWLKSVLYDRAYHWLLLALLDVSYSGALQISHWLIDWLIDWTHFEQLTSVWLTLILQIE